MFIYIMGLIVCIFFIWNLSIQERIKNLQFLIYKMASKLEENLKTIDHLSKKLHLIEKQEHSTSSVAAIPEKEIVEKIATSATPVEPPLYGLHEETKAEPNIENLIKSGARPDFEEKSGLEEKLGANWAVWIGGVALALGAAFLVRYAIVSDLLGAFGRVVAGILFSSGLIRAGEYLRHASFTSVPGRRAYIPGVVTAAGIVGLFSSIYSAYAVYGFIPAWMAFVILGLVGVITMHAAARHGPWLSGLGMVGAYATPLLVSSSKPQAWALAIFILVVSASAFSLSRRKQWSWLAISAMVAATLYGLVLVKLSDHTYVTPTFFILALFGLVAGELIYPAHRDVMFGKIDWVAVGGVAAPMLLALHFAWVEHFNGITLLVILIMCGGGVAVARRFEALAPTAVVSGLCILACLYLWPNAEVSTPPHYVVNRFALRFAMPDALWLWLQFAILPTVAIFLVTSMSLMRRAHAPSSVLSLSLAGAGTPLLALVIAYLRIEGLAFSIPFSVAGAALAVIFAGTAERFCRTENASGRVWGASSIYAAASCSALAMSVAFSAGEVLLVLAFAFSALGAAWVGMMRPLPALRWCSAAFAVLAVARCLRLGLSVYKPGYLPLLGEMTFVYQLLSGTFVGQRLVNVQGLGELILRYAIPTAVLGYTMLLLRRYKNDLPSIITECAGLVAALTLVTSATRYAVLGTISTADGMKSLIDTGVFVMFAFMAVGMLLKRQVQSASWLYKAVPPTLSIFAMAVSSFGLFLAPLLLSDYLGGGIFTNVLWFGYLFPGLAAAFAAYTWRKNGPGHGYDRALCMRLAILCAVTGFIAGFYFVTLQVSNFFYDPARSLENWSTSQLPMAQIYAYTIAWLLYGMALLGVALVLHAKSIRLASGIVIVLTIAKAFLYDMAVLEGIWRALSFIGLGLVLIAIGIIYQKLIFKKIQPLNEERRS